MRKFIVLFALAWIALTAVGILLPEETPQTSQIVAPPPPPEEPDSQKTDAGLVKWPPVSDNPLPPADDKLADNYMILLDTSGSMGEKSCQDGRESEYTKMQVAVDALARFVGALPADANVGVTVFSGTVNTLVPLGPRDLRKLKDRLDKLVPRAKTPLVGALRAGRGALELQAEAQAGYGTYRLVVITDGVSTDGDPGPIAHSIATRTPIAINVIGFCLGAEHSLNMPGITAYSFASNPQDLSKSLEKVRAELPDFSVTSFD